MHPRLQPFRPHADDVWRKLSDQLGGEFLDQGGWRQDKVVARLDPWVVTLDVHSEPHYRHEAIFTRFRAPYVNPDGFRFNIYRQPVWAGVARLLGMQDVRVGCPEIDKKFVVKTNNPAQARRLFANVRLCDLLLCEPDAHLHVRDSGDWFAEEYPEGVDELVLEIEGRVTSLARLEKLYALFAETLHTLCHIGSAYEQDPKLPG